MSDNSESITTETSRRKKKLQVLFNLLFFFIFILIGTIVFNYISSKSVRSKEQGGRYFLIRQLLINKEYKVSPESNEDQSGRLVLSAKACGKGFFINVRSQVQPITEGFQSDCPDLLEVLNTDLKYGPFTISGINSSIGVVDVMLIGEEPFTLTFDTIENPAISILIILLYCGIMILIGYGINVLVFST